MLGLCGVLICVEVYMCVLIDIYDLLMTSNHIIIHRHISVVKMVLCF